MAVLGLSFFLGIAVALAVYFWWRDASGPSQSHELMNAAALMICPPYILSLAVSPNPDSPLALVLTVGTIIFANGFLYAGVAAGAYFVVAVFAKKRGRRE